MTHDDANARPEATALSPGAALTALVALTACAGVAADVVGAVQPRTLLPWVAGFAAAMAWRFRRPRAVDLFDPFVFLSWTHYAPAYVVGAFLFAIGVVVYPYPSLVADPIRASALALLYTAIGYLAMGVGCQWSGARALGARLARLLPAPPADPTIPLGAILALVALGGVATYSAFRAGIVGFAIPRSPGPLDAAATYAGVLMSLGHFLFWFRWFDRRQTRPPWFALVIPLLVVLFSMAIAGNRGSLLSAYLVAALAFRFAHGPLTIRQGAVVLALAFVALAVGMVYGTLFRAIKGGETAAVPATIEESAAATADGATTTSPPPPAGSTAPAAPGTGDSSRPAEDALPAAAGAPRPSLTQQFEVAAATTRALVSDPWTARTSGMLAAVGQRLNLVADVSVTIARYQELRPLEAQYGIANLWTMTWTGLVPRVLWPGKPRVGDARAYSRLYFNWDGNSYAWTPATDLIRNGGPLAIPIGMALLGVALGALGAALVGPASGVVGERAALFSMLLVNVSLEGSYGLLLPTMLRIGLIALAGLTVVRVWSWRQTRIPA